MPEIAGKQVIFRKKLPASKWWPLLPKLQLLDAANALEVLDWPTVVVMVQGTVESWEFDGSPDDPEVIGALDTFEELLPLLRAISQEIQERAASLGEAS
jgi:hypothetical protein